MTESLEWMACFIAPQKRDHFFALTESNPQLQPSKSKLFHQKRPLWLKKKPLQTNQPIKNTEKKNIPRFVFTPQKKTWEIPSCFLFPHRLLSGLGSPMARCPKGVVQKAPNARTLREAPRHAWYCCWKECGKLTSWYGSLSQFSYRVS